MMPRIELRDVEMRFGDIVAVDRTDLVIEDGEYIAVLGPSGCGKTTLVKIISGIWTPTAGRVVIDGVDVTGIPPEAREIGYVFQNIVLFPHMNVEENATYGPKVRGLPLSVQTEIGDEVLQMVDMAGQKGYYPRELSGGAQQKVGLARALANRSKLLILDEPLSALDARVRLELRYALRRVSKELGLTTIHVTHDQEEALSVADRVIVMRKGRIVGSGTPEELYYRPDSLFVANFVGENNFLEGVVKRVAGGWAVIELRNKQFLRVPAKVLRVGEAVVLAIRPEDLGISLKESANSLPGTIEGSRFMGSFRRYDVRMNTDDVLLADGPTYPEFDAGKRVLINFREEDIVIYPRPYEGLREALRLE